MRRPTRRAKRNVGAGIDEMLNRIGTMLVAELILSAGVDP